MARLNQFGFQIDYRLQPFMFYIFVAAMVPHVFEMPHWVSITVALNAAWAYFSSRSKLPPIRPFLLGLASLLFGGIIYWQFKTLLGPDAATPLLLLLASLKLHEIRRLRDALVFLFICTLCVMYYLLYSQTLMATVYMITMIISIAVAFMVVHSPKNKVKEVLKSSPRLVTKDVLLSLPVFLTFFFLFPRFSTPWGRFANDPQANIGFSENLHPGDIAKLAKSEDPAFRVNFSAKDKIEEKDMYWKGMVLDKTDGWGWTQQKQNNSSETQSPARTDGHSIQYEITLEPKFEKRLFVLDRTTHVDWVKENQHNPIFSSPDGVFQTMWPGVSRIQYRGTIENAQTPVHLDDDEREFFTNLPKSFSPKVKTLANEIVAQSPTLDEKITKTLDYFTSQHFQYSLSTEEMPTIDTFLFEKRVGFCEYFATSFALLMRAEGIPARVVIGFQGGELNEYSRYYLVRDKNAHAWVEVFKSNSGWVRVDPTFSVNSIRISMGTPDSIAVSDRSFISQAFYSSQMMWDSINNRYTQFLMNYDFEAQKNILSFGGQFDIKKYQIVLGLVLLAAFFMFIIRIRLRNTVAEAKSPARRLYEKFTKKMAALGVDREPHEGPVQFAERAAQTLSGRADKIFNLTSYYILWEFAGQVPTAEARAQFAAQLKAL